MTGEAPETNSGPEPIRDPIRHFRDLVVYKKAVQLAVLIYQCANELPERERSGLVSQKKRAAVSVALNIAEGYGRKEFPGEFRQFLRIALGSCNEVVACLDVAKALGFIDNASASLTEEYQRLSKQIWTMAKKWRS